MTATPLKLVEAGSLQPLTLRRVDLEIYCDAFLSHTKATMVWTNPTERKLEAELSFPLPENGSICGYAVDIDNKLVPGVIVTKEKARATFEAEVRKDRGGPAIAEQTVGNVFNTRINPFLPHGSRTIQVQFTQKLVPSPHSSEHMTYNYILPFLTPTASTCVASLKVSIPGYFTPSIPSSHSFIDDYHGTTAQWRKVKDNQIGKYLFVLQGSCSSWSLLKPLLITVTGSEDDTSIVCEHCDTDTISIAANIINIPTIPATPPTPPTSNNYKKVALLWDNSKSRSMPRKELEMELSALNTLIEELQRQSFGLDLYTFNVVPLDSPIEFRDQQLPQVISHLRLRDRIVYHGGTDYSSLERLLPSSTPDSPSSPCPYQFWIAVTDGIHTFGRNSLPNLQAPVHILSASSTGDHALLRRWARQSNGKFFNLSSISSESEIIRGIFDQSISFLYASLAGFPLVSEPSPFDNSQQEAQPLNNLISITPTTSTKLNGTTMSFFARLNFQHPALSKLLQAPNDTVLPLTLHFGINSTFYTTYSRTFHLDIRQMLSMGIPKMIACSERAWAQARLSEIQEMIDSLGKHTESEEKIKMEKEQFAIARHYTLVTGNTSLIVLETLQQYLDHMICPPVSLPELYKQYNKRIMERLTEEEGRKFEKTTRVHSWWQRRQKWSDLNASLQQTSNTEISEQEIALRTYGTSALDFKANRQVLHLFEYGREELNDAPITARDAHNQPWHFALPETKQWPFKCDSVPKSASLIPDNPSGDPTWDIFYTHITPLQETTSTATVKGKRARPSRTKQEAATESDMRSSHMYSIAAKGESHKSKSSCDDQLPPEGIKTLKQSLRTVTFCGHIDAEDDYDESQVSSFKLSTKSGTKQRSVTRPAAASATSLNTVRLSSSSSSYSSSIVLDDEFFWPKAAENEATIDFSQFTYNGEKSESAEVTLDSLDSRLMVAERSQPATEGAIASSSLASPDCLESLDILSLKEQIQEIKRFAEEQSSYLDEISCHLDSVAVESPPKLATELFMKKAEESSAFRSIRRAIGGLFSTPSEDNYKNLIPTIGFNSLPEEAQARAQMEPKRHSYKATIGFDVHPTTTRTTVTAPAVSAAIAMADATTQIATAAHVSGGGTAGRSKRKSALMQSDKSRNAERAPMRITQPAKAKNMHHPAIQISSFSESGPKRSGFLSNDPNCMPKLLMILLLTIALAIGIIFVLVWYDLLKWVSALLLPISAATLSMSRASKLSRREKNFIFVWIYPLIINWSVALWMVSEGWALWAVRYVAVFIFSFLPFNAILNHSGSENITVAILGLTLFNTIIFGGIYGMLQFAIPDAYFTEAGIGMTLIFSTIYTLICHKTSYEAKMQLKWGLGLAAVLGFLRFMGKYVLSFEFGTLYYYMFSAIGCLFFIALMYILLKRLCSKSIQTFNAMVRLIILAVVVIIAAVGLYAIYFAFIHYIWPLIPVMPTILLIFFAFSLVFLQKNRPDQYIMPPRELDPLITMPISHAEKTTDVFKPKVPLERVCLPKPLEDFLPAQECHTIYTDDSDIDNSALPHENMPMMNKYDLIQFERPRFNFISCTPEGTDKRKMLAKIDWKPLLLTSHHHHATSPTQVQEEYDDFVRSQWHHDDTAHIAHLYQLASDIIFITKNSPSTSDSYKQQSLACIILSNLTEGHLGKAQLLRAIAYKLEESGLLHEAEHMYRRILEMRGEEPQSYRDLALVLAKRKQYEECIQLFNTILTRCKPDWDARFSQIEVVALMDICGILPQINQLDLVSSGGFHIPYSLVPASSSPILVDLRAVLTWDIDGLDLELQVLEPNGEILTSFSNQSTRGGLLSRDFSGGYGPVEYLAKYAFQGQYSFRAKVRSPCTKPILGGEATLRFTIYTHFGESAIQTSEMRVLRFVPSQGLLIPIAAVHIST